jgi:nicotinate-nucleotide adenylyltransferase
VNIALFGGTFDPIHAGHLQAARVAARRYRLDQVLFIPTGSPPHKVRDHLTDFSHRFAMLALACSEDKRFIPSLLEAPKLGGGPRYSIDTVRKAKHLLKERDRLFFLIGLDAFLDLPMWKSYRSLLDQVDFIVVSRPGFKAESIRRVVPQDILSAGHSRRDSVPLHRSTVHILRGVHVPIASRDVRHAIYAGRRVTGLVPPLVEQYILKEGLYRPRHSGKPKER